MYSKGILLKRVMADITYASFSMTNMLQVYLLKLLALNTVFRLTEKAFKTKNYHISWQIYILIFRKKVTTKLNNWQKLLMLCFGYGVNSFAVEG